MACGNGSVATPHPSELFGDDWMEWGLDAGKADDEPATPVAEGPPASAGSTA